jgi:signal transduction histidine kinase/DNA-binding NarL/FixJ family response regulator
MCAMLQDFLQQQGYALCEYLGGGEFSLLTEPPSWFEEIWGRSETRSKSLRLGDSCPFLEGFLLEAEGFWESRATGTLSSGTWIERSPGEKGKKREIPLEALALTIDDKRVLSIQSQAEAFEERTRVLQIGRNGLLDHERLRKEVQKKEILLHCIIHDLSQPLTAMRGCFDILGMEGGSSRIKQLVEVGKKQSEQQEQMIREVLRAFSADLEAGIETGGGAAKSPNLLTCAEETVVAFAPTFETKGITLRLDPQLIGQRGWRVVGEYTRLKRIFSNLVENSLRYAPSGSVVTIGVEEDERYLKAYVEDQGPGLPKDFKAAEAFKLFSKGKEGGGKAGLGLYFCRITVERWGGTIGCESVVPTGARFWFRLLAVGKEDDAKHNGETLKSPRTNPDLSRDSSGLAAGARESVKQGAQLVDAKIDAEVGAPQLAVQPPPLQVLLADDDSAIRELTELLLRRQGHTVVAVDNGKEALRALSGRHFDVVLLDDEMPGLSGAETARRIRAEEKTGDRHQLMLSLSGNSSDADKRRLLEAGVDACLSKPFHAEELNRALARFASRTREVAKAAAATAAADDDEARLLQSVGGDAKLLQQMIKIFLKDYPKKMAILRKTLARKDAAGVAAAAHALMGSVSIFGAASARRLAEEMQNMGRKSELSGATKCLEQLEEEIVNLDKKLRGYRREASRTGSPSGKGKAGVRRRQKRVKR